MFVSPQTLGLAAVLTLAIAQAVPAANCSLRQPRRQIEQIFPDFTNIKSIDAAIDKDLKARIEAVLGSELSISDVGKHTAYIVLRDGVPIGIVHARTETGARGSIQLVWAIARISRRRRSVPPRHSVRSSPTRVCDSSTRRRHRHAPRSRRMPDP